MTRHVHANAEAPLLRGMCVVVKSHRATDDQPRQGAPGAIARFPHRPDGSVLSRSIPLFFIGRNRNGLWVAREGEGRVGGMFLLKQSALHFAQKRSAPAGCATMLLGEPIELDTENLGNPLMRWIDAALGRLNKFIPAFPPAIPIREKYRKGDWQ